jgi:hypothetical protein
LFIGGILVGLPEWKSTVVGLVLAVIVFAVPGLSRAKRPAARVENVTETGENAA